MIRDYRSSDHKDICRIYNLYIEHSHHTFETIAISETEMFNRIETVIKDFPFIVFEKDEKVIAYAYATRWKSRQAYDQTAESTIYIEKGHEGKGIGKALYSELIRRLALLNLHCILAGIALPNDASIALHEKLGFEKSGVLKEVGNKFGHPIDVAYWSLILN